MAARRTALNPEKTGFQVGPNVRVERGLKSHREDGKFIRDEDGEPESIWIVSKKVDVTDDPDTSYSYRYEEVASYAEDEAGVCPDKAFARADALAGD